MNKRFSSPYLRLGLLEMLALMLLVSVTLAASGDSYTVRWAQVGASGAQAAQSASYRLDTTVGQPLAGSIQSNSYHAQIGYQQAFATPTDCTNPFVDITGNVFYNAIHYLACRSVINGTDSTHYTPAGTATRAQFAKIVILGFGLPLTTPPGGPSFSDVPATYFAYVYIETGYAAGILSGFDQSGCTAHGATYPCYLPNLAITRAQLTRLVVSAAQYPLYTPTTSDFIDVPPQSVFYAAIETAYHLGLINGYPDRTFRPNQPIRRDEMAQIVYKAVITP